MFFLTKFVKTLSFRADFLRGQRPKRLRYLRRLGGVSRRHRFEMISNFVVKREGWHKISRLAGRARRRGQQFVREMQAKFDCVVF